MKAAALFQANFPPFDLALSLWVGKQAAGASLVQSLWSLVPEANDREGSLHPMLSLVQNLTENLQKIRAYVWRGLHLRVVFLAWLAMAYHLSIPTALLALFFSFCFLREGLVFKGGTSSWFQYLKPPVVNSAAITRNPGGCEGAI